MKKCEKCKYFKIMSPASRWSSEIAICEFPLPKKLPQCITTILVRRNYGSECEVFEEKNLNVR